MVTLPQNGLLVRGWAKVVNTVNEALSNMWMTVLGVVLASSIIGLASFMWWSGTAIIHIQDNMATKQDIQDVKDAIRGARTP